MFGEEVYSGKDVSTKAHQLGEVLRSMGVLPGAPVALIARNRPAHVIALYAAIADERNLAMIYPFQSGQAKAGDLERIGPAAVLASSEDWDSYLLEAAQDLGIAGIILPRSRTEPVSAAIEGMRASEPFGRAGRLLAGIQVLSSGTTGPPKRIQLPLKVLSRVTEGELPKSSDALEEDILSWPLGGVGGTMAALSALVMYRPLNVIERFSVKEWVDIVKKAQIRALRMNPTMMRMVLDAEVPKEDLASARAAFGGSAALDPSLEEQFEARYGIPVLWAYGATEFCGTAYAWTPELKGKFGQLKRGSVGRALPGVSGRIVDPETGDPLPANREGLVETLIPLISPTWIRTTDLGLLDDDGFLFLKGRADGAINRGGFKILPETIVTAIRSHPSVFDAAVVGMPDARLGQVPHAVVQLKKGAEHFREADLMEYLKENFPHPSSLIGFTRSRRCHERPRRRFRCRRFDS
jgi:acyl-CoA synthetase (AMP-forming)/AMP-acid ligase II